MNTKKLNNKSNISTKFTKRHDIFYLKNTLLFTNKSKIYLHENIINIYNNILTIILHYER